jgi:hypothetical protein
MIIAPLPNSNSFPDIACFLIVATDAATRSIEGLLFVRLIIDISDIAA